ncbi:N-acetylmuramoyl-L-alanine amidase [Sphingobium ummariense]|uniref:N-acetylmuramoyl-L-alanine amidase n=1 Tax=Sphingobium ummariense RL-3 TaxID=1346791 RepID=T0J4H9_9SPHN|nr:N-acetylmuramoyl-L-alanine amidase [Sphingobium ummariense]EQB32856.1 N-acetylmuramoyl-L-alanine amidase [Sphingobium ummariense RL-3]
MKFGWTGHEAALHKRRMLQSLALAGMLFAGSPGQAGGISAVDVRDDRVVVRFDDRVEGASAFLLDGPRRIALDISGAQVGQARYAGTGTAIAAVRQGQLSEGTARVVLDLSAPATLGDARIAPDGRSLSFTVQGVSDGAFRNAIGKGRLRFDAPADMAQRPQKRIHSITVPIPAASSSIGLPAIEGARDGARPLVVIDAGHGGHDPGAINKESGRREKDVTLAITQAIRDQLVRSGRVRVALTRDDDRFLVLQERYGIARRLNADLFISVHADSAENAEAHGATVYTLSETASDREAARLAARENKADILNGVNLGGQSGDVSSILIDLTQRESMNISANFARLLQREASPYVPFRSAYHRFASLMVLKAPDTPSVLFETGYISNGEDAAFLSSREGQQKIARGVARAIEIHFARRLAMRDGTVGG